MEKQRPFLHEVITPAKEIGQLVMGWAKDVIVPPQSVDLPQATPADIVERTYSAMTAPFEDMQEE